MGNNGKGEWFSMDNKLGELLRELRGKTSLRIVSTKTNGKISWSYLGIIERGVHPNNGQPVKPKPETLKILSEVYDYPYKKLLEVAGYLEKEDEVQKIYDNIVKLPDEDLERLVGLLKQNKIVNF